MRIGIPKELKESEGRVGLTPGAVKVLSWKRHEVYVENGAGEASGYSNNYYVNAGAYIRSQSQIWNDSDLIVKVKEPLPQEYQFFRKDLKIMAFFHFPANKKLRIKCLESEICAIPYEHIVTPSGARPILRAMSIVAGEVAVDMAAQHLRKEHGGMGIIMEDAIATIIGAAGNVGSRAHALLKNRVRKVYALDKRITPNLTQQDIMDAIYQSEIVIGAAVNKEGGAPHLITRDMVKRMKPGSVLVDVAIDEGGISETSRSTTYDKPSYVEYGVVHVCVPNLPGGVPRSSTPRLANEILPWALLAAGE